MNLRDQLLKAGLVDKKRAEQVAARGGLGGLTFVFLFFVSFHFLRGAKRCMKGPCP